MEKYFPYRKTRELPTESTHRFFDISHELCYEVEKISKKASLPIVTHEQAIEKRRSLHNKYSKTLKACKERKDRPSYRQRLSDFRYKVDFLFDLSKFKCPDMIFNCKCFRENKVFIKEREFLENQRGLRKMVIDGLDKKETSKLKKKLKQTSSDSNKCRSKRSINAKIKLKQFLI